jgi:CBS domain-containing protein
MPNFVLTPQQIDDITAYMLSLRGRELIDGPARLTVDPRQGRYCGPGGGCSQTRRRVAMRARDVMTPNVATVAPEDTVDQIIEVLIERGVSAAPVVDRDELVGIVSEGDLLRRRELDTQKRYRGWRAFLADPDALAREYVKSRGMRARDVMSKPVISVGQDSPIGEIAELMEKHHIKRVAVVDGGKLSGIVTRADLVRALVWRQVGGRQTDDAAIRNTLRQRLGSQHWMDSGTIRFTVKNGVVALSGFVGSAEQREAVRVMAESIPGVTGVTSDVAVRLYSPIGL